MEQHLVLDLKDCLIFEFDERDDDRIRLEFAICPSKRTQFVHDALKKMSEAQYGIAKVTVSREWKR